MAGKEVTTWLKRTMEAPHNSELVEKGRRHGQNEQRNWMQQAENGLN